MAKGSLMLAVTLHLLAGFECVVPNLRQAVDISFSEPSDLGLSLLDTSGPSDLGESLMPGDLGDSLLFLSELDSTHSDWMDNGVDFNDTSEQDGHEQFLTSTPRKRNDNNQVLDTTDLEQFSSVLATPRVPTPMTVFLNSADGGKLKAKSLSEQNIMSSICQPCKCPQQCMDSISYDHCRIMRQIYWSFSRQQRSLFLTNKLKFAEKHDKWTLISIDNGLRVCLKAFGLIHNINKNTVIKHRRLVERNSYISIRRHTLASSGTVDCINFMEEYASMYGDRMPNSDDVLLPYKTTKKALYEKYKLENEHVLSPSGFYAIWKRHFPNVKIKKTNTFSQCSKCASLIKKMEATPFSETKRMKSLRTAREEHIDRTMLERKCYRSKRAASRKNPEEFLSLIIDGMDQSKTDLPHFNGRRSKAINGADLLKTHVTGVLSHGHDLFVTYLDILQYPHDPNLTINVLLKFLLDLSEKEETLPPILFLQMNNCYRENKNRFVFGFLELLVRQRIFNEVHISYLYSGHTHEDIDAGFSRISRQLRKNNAETIEDLCKFLPNVQKLDLMLDVRNWIKDSLCKLSMISQPLHYKIVSHGNTVKVYYKGQQHTLWQTLNGRGTFLRNIPNGKPKRLKPDFSKVSSSIDRVDKQIQSITHMFSSQTKVATWKDFLQNYKNYFDDSTNICSWINVLPRQSVGKKKRKAFVMDPMLQQMLDKESAIPQVTCEKKTLKKTKSKAKRNTAILNRSKKKQGTIHQNRSKSKGLGNKRARLTKPTNQPRSNKSKPRQPRRELFTKKSTQLVPLQDDVKKHLWVMIFLHLLNMCVSLAVLILFILQIFINMLTVEELILHVNLLWLKVLADHMRQNHVEVNKKLFPVLFSSLHNLHTVAALSVHQTFVRSIV